MPVGGGLSISHSSNFLPTVLFMSCITLKIGKFSRVTGDISPERPCQGISGDTIIVSSVYCYCYDVNQFGHITL